MEKAKTQSEAFLSLIIQPLLTYPILYFFYHCYNVFVKAEAWGFTAWVSGYMTLILGLCYLGMPMVFKQYKDDYLKSCRIKPTKIFVLDLYQLITFAYCSVAVVITLENQGLIIR